MRKIPMTIEYIGPGNFTYFEYYASGGVNGAFKESLAPGKIFRIDTVSLHLSVVHPSVEDFVIRVSSARGSAFNQIIISQAFSGVNDYLWQPNRPLQFNASDEVIFSLFVKSGANNYGLMIRGWSVLG
jgi:hypothetical protein